MASKCFSQRTGRNFRRARSLCHWPPGSRLHLSRAAREPAVLRPEFLRTLSQSRPGPLAALLLLGTSLLDTAVHTISNLGDATHVRPDTDYVYCIVPNHL